jgi:hypothetical protein
VLREGEVDRLREMGAGERPAGIQQPVEHPEREVVAEPDQGAGGEKLRRRHAHADPLDQVVDEQGRGPQRGRDEQDHDRDRDPPRPSRVPRHLRRVSHDERQEQRDLERRNEPRQPHRRLARQPQPDGDGEADEDDESRGRRPARLSAEWLFRSFSRQSASRAD